MTGHVGADALDALGESRAAWLSEAVAAVASSPFVDAVWLEGSLGRGDADAFSDIDLVLSVSETTPAGLFADPVAGLGLPGRVLYVRDKPRNAPAGGAYRAVCVELAGLPVLVDLYLWPTATAAMSATAQLLPHHGGAQPARSELGFLPLISQYPSGDTRGSDPFQPETVLLLVQLAAKYLARGDHDKHAAILRQLQVPPAAGVDTAALRGVLAQRVGATDHPQLRAAVAAAHRLIDVVEHLHEATSEADLPAAGGEVR